MEKPTIDELLEQLEEAREAGREIDLEKLCEPWPELLAPLQQRWQRLLQFQERFSVDNSSSEPTRQESTAEVRSKLQEAPERLDGTRIVMQTELHLERFHDRGGLGEVYRAVDCDLARDIAVKLLRIDRQSQPNREDFFRESQIIGRMTHPGVVAIHGMGETIDGRPFYAMPFLDGGNLRSRTTAFHRQNPGPLVDDRKEFRDLLYRLVAVCKTVAYAHSRGIVHRDLKAENILLGKYGETLVIDWGCATQVSRDERFRVSGERTLQLSGVEGFNSSAGLTLRYASPEQLHGSKPVGPESDIYSLGAILYLLVTGRSPLENEPDERVRGLVLRGELPPVESIKTGIPKALSAICHHAMALEPDQRYATALQMADDIERYLADEPTSVCRLSWGMKLARLVRRNRTASLILVGTLLLGSALLTLAFGGQRVLAQRAEASAQHRLRMAASLVSNVGGFEISRRISLLEVEAAQPALVQAMETVLKEPENTEHWDSPQNLIYGLRDKLQAQGLKLDSLVLNDARGTQIARAPKEPSVGKNYAYRQYFHGLAEDLDPNSAEYQSNPPPPASVPIVSNAYASTNRGTEGQLSIKVSISVPIMSSQSEEPLVIGRLGMSLPINELAIFDSLEGLPLNAILFETRDYAWGTGRATGLVLDQLQHDSESKESGTGSGLTSDLQVQDAMPRLGATSLAQLLKFKGNRANLIENFSDPIVSSQQAEVACAELSIPYRTDVATGWRVLFIEAKAQ